jgi:hypothetical protein
VTALIPVSAANAALVARAAAWRVEPALTASTDDGRTWARTRNRASEESVRSQTILPPDRSLGGPQTARGARAYDQAARWPSSAFFAQHLSQETLPDDAPTLGHAAGAAKYPSLDFDTDIFLPGESLAVAGAPVRRVDITV